MNQFLLSFMHTRVTVPDQKKASVLLLPFLVYRILISHLSFFFFLQEQGVKNDQLKPQIKLTL